MANRDEADLALTATVTASSSGENTPPSKAANGWNRVVGDGRNAWAPKPEAPAPHWLQLQLAAPAEVDTVHVTLEKRASGFVVEAWSGEAWKRVATAGETRRRHVLRFDPVKTDRVRIVWAEAAKGGVCEVRLYAEGGREKK